MYSFGTLFSSMLWCDVPPARGLLSQLSCEQQIISTTGLCFDVTNAIESFINLDQALTKIVKKLLKCLYLSLKNSEIAGVIWKLSVSMFCENLGYLFAVRAFWKKLQEQGSGAQDKGPFLAILDDHTLKVYVYISHVVLVPTFFGTGEVPGSCGLNFTAIFKCSFLSVVIKLSIPSHMPCPPKSFALFCLFACTFLHVAHIMLLYARHIY